MVKAAVVLLSIARIGQRGDNSLVYNNAIFSDAMPQPKLTQEEAARDHFRRIFGGGSSRGSSPTMEDDGGPARDNTPSGSRKRPASPTIEDGQPSGSKSPKNDFNGEEMQRGEPIYQDSQVAIFVQQVKHKKRTRFAVDDHLYQVKIVSKTKNAGAPLLINIDTAIDHALVKILDNLKSMYPSRQSRQIYLTIIEKGILNGICSSNWDINTPSEKLSRHVVTQLYNYLKSNSTLRLNPSFKIMIKVLSLSHSQDLEERPPRRGKKPWKKHVFKVHYS